MPRYVPPSGFLNLLAVFSSDYLVALFHTTSTCGVRPSECSPHRQHLALVELGFLQYEAS